MRRSTKTKTWLVIITVVVLIGCVLSYVIYHHHQVVEAAKPNCENPTIKGNISLRTGEKIYHLTSDRDYGKTVISPSTGERMFCSEQDAQAAGWRHAQTY